MAKDDLAIFKLLYSWNLSLEEMSSFMILMTPSTSVFSHIFKVKTFYSLALLWIMDLMQLNKYGEFLIIIKRIKNGEFENVFGIGD